MRTLDFTERIDARPLAVCRIIVGCAALLRGGVTADLLIRLFGEGVVRGRDFDWLPELTPLGGVFFVVLWMAVSFLFTIGFRTRISGASLAALSFYYLFADQNLWANHMYYLFLLVFLLTLGDCGADLSVDWRRRGRPAATVLRWPALLIQIQVSLIYFYAAVNKVNPAFLSGEFLLRDMYVPQAWKNPAVFEALSWATVAFEFMLALALWIPRLKWPFAIAGTLFHVAIPLTNHLYGGLIVFSMIMIAPYLLFLPARLSRSLADGLLRLAARAGLPDVLSTPATEP
jgi:HTTM domain